ncbi:MAG: GNAT family N-acetyltransferase [Deltaproteobacteria bacterium]|mgnify:CR=1 FL=1|nr:GNAT family N-acetyltransferase [Candidatus Zymogenaceae bacterium]
MIRKARIEDIPAMRRLIEPYGKSGDMLPVSLSELYDRIRSYFVFDREDDGVVGAAALHVTWGPHGMENNGGTDPPIGSSSALPMTGGLAEIRSLAVNKAHQNIGIAGKLIDACIADAPSLGVNHIFVLTYIPEFFRRFGFTVVDKAVLPHKIWSHCLKCVYFPDCRETAMILDLERE